MARVGGGKIQDKDTIGAAMTPIGTHAHNGPCRISRPLGCPVSSGSNFRFPPPIYHPPLVPLLIVPVVTLEDCQNALLKAEASYVRICILLFSKQAQCQTGVGFFKLKTLKW